MPPTNGRHRLLQLTRDTTPLPTWAQRETAGLELEVVPNAASPYTSSWSKYNPTPGTGHTGMYAVPPNNYPHYGDDERYTPAMQADGGQLSEWTAMYNPSKDEAEAHRAAAFEARKPHGYVEPGDKYSGQPTIDLWVVSDLHEDHEYGAVVDPSTGLHSGGPFQISVPADMRVEDLRIVIRDYHACHGDTPSKDMVYCVADGHVGKRAARFLAANVAQYVQARLPARTPDARNDVDVQEYARDVRKAMCDAFVALDNDLLASRPTSSGASFTVVVVNGPLISVAHVGDSEAVLDTGASCVEMTHTHRIASNAAEATRLRDEGLLVAPLSFGLRGPATDGQPGVGPLRLWPGGLTVSRTMGDYDSGTGVSPIPHIKQVVLLQGGCRIIVASDGLWDSVSGHAKAASLIHTTPIFSAATELVRIASTNARVIDDTTVIVIDVLADGLYTGHFPETATAARQLKRHGTTRTRLGSNNGSLTSAPSTTDAAPGCFGCFGRRCSGAPSPVFDASRRDEGGGGGDPHVALVADVDGRSEYPELLAALNRPQLGARYSYAAGATAAVATISVGLQASSARAPARADGKAVEGATPMATRRESQSATEASSYDMDVADGKLAIAQGAAAVAVEVAVAH
ncbi:hypothetical protein FOA52_007645 [Chlamydomonas sp. UWO 241]|nr:hypothetical protein FOA52_007645 [Chlamydomonas sp. UWO 241]